MFRFRPFCNDELAMVELLLLVQKILEVVKVMVMLEKVETMETRRLEQAWLKMMMKS